MKLHVRVITFNLGNTSLSTEDLERLLGDMDEDLICLSLQESENAPNLEQIFECCNSSSKEYVALAFLSVAQIHLLLLAKIELAPCIKDVKTSTSCPPWHTSSVPKGGLFVAGTIEGKRLCFIGCHLPAHEHQFEDRNAFFREFTEEGLSAVEAHSKGLVIWAGDLNYRLTCSYETAVSLAKDRKFAELYQYDQLKDSKEKGLAFSGYSEGVLQFRPTYKYKIGQREEYEVEPRRVPSFTDRCLWKVDQQDVVVTQLQYTAIDSIVSSDHSPVVAEFLLEL